MLTIILLALIVYVYIYRKVFANCLFIAPALIPLIAAAVQAGAQGIKSHNQRQRARNLKPSRYIPEELVMNKDLAQLQANSGQFPGQAKAEENVRRSQANALSAVSRSAGGDTGKIAAGSVASQTAAQNAFDRLNGQGKEFSQNALLRLTGANRDVAGQRLSNKNAYDHAKISLLQASDQNYMNAFNSLMSGAMASASMSNGGGGGGGGASTYYGGRGGATDSFGRFYPSNINNPWVQ